MGSQPLPAASGIGAIRRFGRGLAAWRRNNDPLVERSNGIALLVAFNTPFYPLYVWWTAGSGGMPVALLTLCSFPFFLAVPLVASRSGRLGRAMLVVVGVLNTVFCTWLLGTPSGTELFALPCITIAAQSFRPSERELRWGLMLLPLAALLLHGQYGTAPHIYDAAQYAALFDLNLFSVGCLSFYLGLVFAP